MLSNVKWLNLGFDGFLLISTRIATRCCKIVVYWGTAWRAVTMTRMAAVGVYRGSASFRVGESQASPVSHFIKCSFAAIC